MVIQFLTLLFPITTFIVCWDWISNSWFVCPPGSHLNCCLIQSVLLFHFFVNNTVWYWSIFYSLQSTLKCEILCYFPTTIVRGKFCLHFINEKTESSKVNDLARVAVISFILPFCLFKKKLSFLGEVLNLCGPKFKQHNGYMFQDFIFTTLPVSQLRKLSIRVGQILTTCPTSHTGGKSRPRVQSPEQHHSKALPMARDSRMFS